MSRVLIVADEAWRCDRIRQALDFEGRVVLTTLSLHDGLKLVQESPFALIVQDVGCYPETAFALYRALQARDVTAAIPLLVLSDEPLKLSDPRGIPNGSNDFNAEVSLLQEALMRLAKGMPQTFVTVSTPLSAPPLATVPLSLQAPIAEKLSQTVTAIQRLSHELREPLSNMNVALHMLQRAQSDVERDRYIRVLREEYNRELQLLSQLDRLQERLSAA